LARAIPVKFDPEINVRDWPNSKNVPLFNYVARKDTSFQYEDTGIVLNEERKQGNWVGYLLNVTSQTWLTDAEVSISKWTF
jgi:hypothetical protein